MPISFSKAHAKKPFTMCGAERAVQRPQLWHSDHGAAVLHQTTRADRSNREAVRRGARLWGSRYTASTATRTSPQIASRFEQTKIPRFTVCCLRWLVNGERL